MQGQLALVRLTYEITQNFEYSP